MPAVVLGLTKCWSYSFCPISLNKEEKEERNSQEKCVGLFLRRLQICCQDSDREESFHEAEAGLFLSVRHISSRGLDLPHCFNCRPVDTLFAIHFRILTKR